MSGYKTLKIKGFDLSFDVKGRGGRNETAADFTEIRAKCELCAGFCSDY